MLGRINPEYNQKNGTYHNVLIRGVNARNKMLVFKYSYDFIIYSVMFLVSEQCDQSFVSYVSYVICEDEERTL